MVQKIIIDADPGIGDALAVAVALADPELDVLALTGAGGCVTSTRSAQNLQALVEALDPPKWPRIGVGDFQQRLHLSEGISSEATDWPLMKTLNGVDGLGDWKPAIADLHHPKEAVKLMSELSRQYPHEVIVLTLGPLTNLALAVERDAEFLSRLQGVVCLAGSVTQPGDVTPVGEFNVFHDPEAARLILRYPATKTLVPLDVTRQVMLTFEHLERLQLTEETGQGRLLQQLIPFALRAHHHQLGVEGMWIAEVTALASVARPHLFQRLPMSLDVELDGKLTRGMTVFDRRPHPKRRENIDVLVQVDVQGVLDYLTSMIKMSGG